MSPHKSRMISGGAVALAVLLPLASAAQEQGYPFRLSNFKFEFFSGYASIRPGELNAIASYEEAYLQFYYLQRYNAYVPQGCEVNFERTGDRVVRPLKWGTPWGARLKYELSPTLALAVGFQYLDASQESRVGLQATVRDPARGTISDRYDNPGFGLSLKAWLPQLSATFGWNLGPVFRYEVFIAGGPMFAEIKAVTDVRRTYADWNGYRSDYASAREIKGTGKSWSGELGAVLRIRPAKFFDLFGEASYVFRQAPGCTGPGTSSTKSSDSVSGEVSNDSAWDGAWRLATLTSTTSWGTFVATTAGNTFTWGQAGVKKFVLQFSGFQLKFGLSVRL